MTKRIALAPLAVLVSIPLLLNASLCSLCSMFDPSAEELASPPPSTASGVTDPAPELRSTPASEAPPDSVAEIPLEGSYSDPEGFFSIRYPQAWSTHVAGSEMQFWADAQGEAALAISLKIKAPSPDVMLRDVSDLLATRFGNYQEVSRQETSLSGYQAIWIEQVHDWDGLPQRGFMAGVVRNRVGYLVLAYAPAERYPDLGPTLRAMAGSLRVTQFEEAPPYAEWPTYKSPHFIFHYMPGTFVADDIAAIATQHEQAFEFNVGRLDVDYEGPISFYFYPSAASLYRATARDAGFAIVEASEVHALWVSRDDHQSLGHEMTHVITFWTLGEPSEALLGEGVAVCLDHTGPHPHARASALLESGRLAPLSEILGNDWFEHDPATVYPESGSLVCWLLEQYDIGQFKQIYPRENFPVALQEVYGLDLHFLEEDWRTMLEKF